MIALRDAQEFVREQLPPLIRHKRTMRTVDPRVDTELFLVDVLIEEGQTAIDVGANRGIYSMAMKDAGARVIAFEPNRQLTNSLQRLLGPSCTVVPAGISATAGEAEFFVPILGGSEAATRGSLLRNDEPGLTGSRSTRVLTIRLDDMALTGVGLVKIDVEGHEMSALRSMTDTLTRERPHLIIESEARHDEANPGQLFAHLDALQYRGFFRHGKKLHGVESFEVELHQRADDVGSADYTMNFLFLPEEEVDAVLPALERRVSQLLT